MNIYFPYVTEVFADVKKKCLAENNFVTIGDLRIPSPFANVLPDWQKRAAAHPRL